MRPIDYKTLDNAQLYYSNLGYVNVTSPWKIPPDICNLVSGHYKEFVGSAEQSLYYLKTKGELLEGVKYQSITPCFRYEDTIDNIHTHEFIKLELIMFNPGDFHIKQLMQDAYNFYKQYSSNLEIVETDIGYDIEINGIEVGSYYNKTVKGVNYVCGTGVALPRFQESLMLGYSNKPIIKGKVGFPSKIIEEFDEFIDAVQQSNPIMALVELSDLIGSIDMYLEKYNLNLTDLLQLSNSTQRSFIEGVRKSK